LERVWAWFEGICLVSVLELKVENSVMRKVFSGLGGNQRLFDIEKVSFRTLLEENYVGLQHLLKLSSVDVVFNWKLI
jgi:hypothetical protein